jgi:dCMP deaminase
MKNIDHYMAICDEIAKMSKCLSRKIGVIAITPDGTFIGSGYNGPSRGVPHCNSPERLEWLTEELKKTHSGDVRSFILENGWGSVCPRYIMRYKSGEGLHICSAGHAERNCLINCAREGIRVKGSYLIMNCPLPCVECSKSIINAGVVKIFCKTGPDYDSGSRWLLNQASIEIIQTD